MERLTCSNRSNSRRIMDGFAYVPSSIFSSDQGSEIERSNHSIQNV
ncbi:hypothetical protein ACQKCU_03910 [Heyndrickxia sporothermodurans]